MEQGIEEVQRAADRFKLTFLREPDLGATLFLQSQPLGCNPTFPPEWALKRLRKWELPCLLDILPIFGAPRGTETATHFALNQRGEEVGYDLFDTTTNCASRHDWHERRRENLQHRERTGGIALRRAISASCWIPWPTTGPSRAFWDGVYVQLNFETPPCINPFYGPLDITHRSFIAANLNEMAGQCHRAPDVDRV